MEEEVPTVMETFLSNVTTVFTSVLDWTGQVATMVLEQPVFLVPVILSIACIGIGIFKRLSN